MVQEMKDKYLSIITNFGCHWSCPYCIVKNNNINIPGTKRDSLYNLPYRLAHSDYDIVSVSGGGDPLWNYEQHKDYYKSLNYICEKYKLPIEIHTSMLRHGYKYPTKRIVYHVLNYDDLARIEQINNEIIRVVFVVHQELTVFAINRIANYVNNSKVIQELSFRQMVDSEYKTTSYHSEFLEKYHKIKWHYIKQDDYNTYYVDGKIETQFENFRSF